MLAIAAAVVLQTAPLPEKATVSYSGIPDIVAPNITIQSHTATILIDKDQAEVSTLTLVKNNGGAGTATITLPIGAADQQPAISANSFTVTWANAPVALTSTKRADQLSGPGPVTGTGKMVNLGSYALRVSYKVPLGRCGFDRKQYLVAYDLTSRLPIGTLMVTYKFAPKAVFRLPAPMPKLGWQIGERGAFTRVVNYDGAAGLSHLAFYSGGFGSGF